MKPFRYTFSALLFSALFIFLFSQTAIPQQSGNIKNKFYLGQFTYFDNFNNPANINRFKELSSNMMQSYNYHRDYDNQNQSGGFYDAVSNYSGWTNTYQLSPWYSNFGENSMMLNKEKAVRPAYGQRSTYQTEYSDLGLRIVDFGLIYM